MDVLVAPDSFGGTLRAGEVTDAFRLGWLDVRPSDTVRTLPMSDGGEGLLAVLGAFHPGARRTVVEVAGTDTRPVDAPVLWLDERTAVLESATICGLPPAGQPRRPLEATSYGVGQALAHVAAEGAEQVVLGLGGTGVVDGGSGALNGLGMRLRVADGSGLRVGAGDLARCTDVDPGWARWPDGVRLTLLADTDLLLADAVPRFGPQKGVTAGQVGPVTDAIASWADVLCTAFPGTVSPLTPGSGAAGGLGFALAVALGGELVSGSGWVATHLGLDAAVAGADLVVTGEGRLDATSATGKVVAGVLSVARARRRAVAVIAGLVAPGAGEAIGVPAERIVTAPATTPGPAAHDAVRRAAMTLAQRTTSVHSAAGRASDRADG